MSCDHDQHEILWIGPRNSEVQKRPRLAQLEVSSPGTHCVYPVACLHLMSGMDRSAMPKSHLDYTMFSVFVRLYIL